MRRLLSYLPFLASVAIFASLYASAENSSRLPYTVAVIGVVVLAASGTLCYQALLRGSSIAPGAMPALLIAGVTFAFFFIEDNVLRLAVAVAASILFLVLVRHLAESTKLEAAAAELRALSEWSAMVALVGLCAGLLAAVTFLNWNVWFSAMAFAAVAVYTSFTLARLGRIVGFLVPMTVSLVLVECFIVIAMLPTSHWVGAGILGAIAYLLFSIMTTASFISIKRAIFSAAAICAVLLATARWR